MTFVAAFPTKLVILASKRGQYFSQTVTDAVKAYDSSKTVFIKRISDSFAGDFDIFSYRGKAFLEVVRSSDQTVRFALKRILELVAINEILRKIKTAKFTETSVVGDRLKKTMYKPFYELDYVQERVFRNFPKSFAETSRVSEVFKRVIALKITEVPRTYETLKRYTYKQLAEQNRASDRIARLLIKKSADLTRLAELASKQVSKYNAETSRLSDFAKWVFGKYVYESARAVETAKKFTLKPFSEQTFVSEIVRKASLKMFAEIAKAYEIAKKEFIKPVIDTVYSEFVAAPTLPVKCYDSLTLSDLLYYVRGLGMRDRVFVSERSTMFWLLNFAEQVLHYDLVGKLVTKIYEFDSACSGWVDRTVQVYRIFPEAVIASEQIKRMLIRNYMDLVTTYDRIITLRVCTRILIDSIASEYGFSKHYLTHKKDTELTIDILRKEIGKLLREQTIASEFIIKYVTKQFTEKNILRELVMKYIATNVSDLAYTTEIVVKVMYSLAGQIVRRVYFLPPEYQVWWDIILASDHNTKVQICKALLEAFKRIRDKLGG
jgi:hypothetical protein